MNTIKQLLKRDLIQIDDAKNFSQVENKLQNNDPTVFLCRKQKRYH